MEKEIKIWYDKEGENSRSGTSNKVNTIIPIAVSFYLFAQNCVLRLFELVHYLVNSIGIEPPAGEVSIYFSFAFNPVWFSSIILLLF